MLRLLPILAATTLLSGCALPLPFTIASMMVDGVSYVTTDKSLSDHGLSAITARDCAVHRLITDGYICHDGMLANAAEAPSEPLAERPDAQVGTTTPSVAKPVVAAAPKAPAAPRVSPETVPPATSGAPGPGIYMVIGSSRDISTARAVSDLHRDMKPWVHSAPAGGRRTVYRIIVGPIAESDYSAARRNAYRRGLTNTWAMRINPVAGALPAPVPTVPAVPDREAAMRPPRASI